MDPRTRGGPDVALVRAAQERDAPALDALVAASLPLVYNIVGRALDGHADVDDVVQETLLRMVRYLPELREPEAFRSWLVAIALRQVRDREHRRRTMMTRRVDMVEAPDVPDAGSDFANLTILRLGLTDQRREVAEATRWLADEDRSLLALWWLEEAGELDRTDLARALGLSAPHATVRVARMKDQMQTARAVVRALRAQPQCPELGWLTSAWNSVPSPLWRKRIGRHVRDCAWCGQRAAGLLPMERLLAGAALVPVPPALAARLGYALPHTGPPGVPPTSASGGGAHPATSNASAGTHPAVAHGAASGRRAVRMLTHVRHLIPAGSHAAIAAASVVAVVAGTVVVVQVTGHPSTPAAAASPSSTATATTSTNPPGSSPSQSAIRSATPSPRPSPSTVPAAPPVPAVSARKGVSAWSFTGVDTALKRSGARWYYTWSTTHAGITTPNGVQFVPMIWGSGSVTTAALGQAKAVGGDLLGFNEPDLGSQSNMSVTQALDLWPKLQSTGLMLGSPAVASDGATAGGWLDQFMKGANGRGYRVDFIALHWYGSDFTTSAAVAQLKSYLQAVYQRYHKPIWLTEYALIKFTSGGSQYPTDAQQAAFVTASTAMLDGLPYLKRYAWFALPATSGTTGTGLFRSGAVATPAGTAFEKAR
jgi:RNA polymerase sigma factor (sigma-70 family)